jgi:hypothetical protein
MGHQVSEFLFRPILDKPKPKGMFAVTALITTGVQSHRNTQDQSHTKRIEHMVRQEIVRVLTGTSRQVSHYNSAIHMILAGRLPFGLLYHT